MLHKKIRHFLKKEFLCHNSALVETGAAWQNHAVNQIRNPFWEPSKRFNNKKEINVAFWCNFVSKVVYFDWSGILIARKSLGDFRIMNEFGLQRASACGGNDQSFSRWEISDEHISWFFWRTWNKARHFFDWTQAAAEQASKRQSLMALFKEER